MTGGLGSIVQVGEGAAGKIAAWAGAVVVAAANSTVDGKAAGVARYNARAEEERTDMSGPVRSTETGKAADIVDGRIEAYSIATEGAPVNLSGSFRRSRIPGHRWIGRAWLLVEEGPRT